MNLSFLAAGQQFTHELLDYMDEQGDVDIGLLRMWTTAFFVGLDMDDEDEGWEYE